jgi:hypothetical protein
VLLGVTSGLVTAQQNNPDAVIDAIRSRTEIGESDERRIADWVQARVDEFSDHASFVERLIGCFENASNTDLFRTKLCDQTAEIAETTFARPDLNRDLAFGLARVLVEMGLPEALPGFLAGLKSADPRARYLSATGLVAQRRAVSGTQTTLDQAVRALRDAGVAETAPVALGRIYEALAVRGQVGAVFDAYLAIFDKRLERRRAAALRVDGAEIHAFEFLRRSDVVSALDQNQRAELVRRVAVFMRLDAGRYNDPKIAPPTDETTPDLNFDERDRIERLLDAEEEILEAIVGAGGGGKIRDILSSRGSAAAQSVLNEVYVWVGNAATNASGPLNEAPWNVPVGAP